MTRLNLKKATRWLNVNHGKSGGKSKNECKKCGSIWTTKAPAKGSNHNAGRILLNMICPERCNHPAGYEEIFVNALVSWYDLIEVEREVFIEASIDVMHCELDDDATLEEIRQRESEVLKETNDFLSRYIASQENERSEFIVARLAEWLEQQYKTHIAQSKNAVSRTTESIRSNRKKQ